MSKNLYCFTEQELEHFIKAIEDSVFDNCEIEITGERTCNTEAFLKRTGIFAGEIIGWLNHCENCKKTARTKPFITEKDLGNYPDTYVKEVVVFLCEECQIKMQKLSLEAKDENEGEDNG